MTFRHAYVASALIPVDAPPNIGSSMRKHLRLEALAMLLEKAPCTERDEVKITVSIAPDEALSSTLGPFMIATAEALCSGSEGCPSGGN